MPETFETMRRAILHAYGIVPPKLPTAQISRGIDGAARELLAAGYTGDDVAQVIALARERGHSANPWNLAGLVWLLPPKAADTAPEPASEPLAGQTRGPQAALSPVVTMPDGTRCVRVDLPSGPVFRRLPADTPLDPHAGQREGARSIEDRYRELEAQQALGYG